MKVFPWVAASRSKPSLSINAMPTPVRCSRAATSLSPTPWPGKARNAHRHRWALRALPGQGVGESDVAARLHRTGVGIALIDKDGFDRLAATQGKTFIDNRFQRIRLAAAHLAVGRD